MMSYISRISSGVTMLPIGFPGELMTTSDVLSGEKFRRNESMSTRFVSISMS